MQVPTLLQRHEKVVAFAKLSFPELSVGCDQTPLHLRHGAMIKYFKKNSRKLYSQTGNLFYL